MSRSGILLVDKPGGITSHGVVSRTRKLAGTRKVGHAGTLDPMATGLLVLGINNATRLLTYLVGLDKEYLATIRLGGSTPSDDADSPIDTRADADTLATVTEPKILAAIRPLTGEIQQVPSAVSAIKVDGQRAYARVRAGETVELTARAVTISAFDVRAIRRGEFIDVDVRIECSTGTYIRALARDLGSALCVGGHLTALRRTRVGPFEVTNAAELEVLDVAAGLHTPAEVARLLFSVLELTAQEAIDLSHGKRLKVAGHISPTAKVEAEDSKGASMPVAAIAPDGRLVGLVSLQHGVAKSIINFPEDERAS